MTSRRAISELVADSVPENEYQETLNKARSLLHAIRIAEEQMGG
jgi:anthranilate/para-aminobenzoate synthase component I